jgi:hypothetical protein
LVVVSGNGATAGLGNEDVIAKAVVPITGITLQATLSNVFVWGDYRGQFPSATYTDKGTGAELPPTTWTQIAA